MKKELTPEIILQAYANGYFPMAEGANSKDLYWYEPDPRGQLPIENLHIPRKLIKTIKKKPYEIRCDTAFDRVITLCAEPMSGRDKTWINQEIIDLFCELHEMGFAHSVETWEGDNLVSGIYGIALGAAFFGESMFSRKTDASKIALVYLTARLWKQGFKIFDTQYINDHLKQFGVYEISKEEYRAELLQALKMPAQFSVSEDVSALPSGASSSVKLSFDEASVVAFLQSRTQTS